jgi:hypothetical protein
MSSNKQAKVAKVVDPFVVVLTVGKSDGVDVGDDFIIYRVGDEIFDPDTGESLGDYEQIVGRGTVTHVQDKICTLESSEVKSSGRKVIRKFSQVNSLSGLLALNAAIGRPSEEIVEEPEKVLRPFSHAEVGDFAKRL